MPFEFEKTKIPGVIIIKPKIFGDNRGFFLESYEKGAFEKAGIKGEFIQENHSKSQEGVIRAFHFQKGKYAQAKLVRCISGELLDVAVDLRVNSPTFGKYVAKILSEENKNLLYIPKGFGHGFAALSEYAELVYKVDNDYSLKNEGGIIWNDLNLNINWPFKNPIISDKDKNWPSLEKALKENLLF